MDRVFLDHNATTMPSKEVLNAVQSFDMWGNPSSIHSSGRGAKAAILKIRRSLEEALGCSSFGEVIFTSGGSEANNMVVKGLLSKLKERGQDTIVSSSVEHPALSKTLTQVEALGFKIIRVPVTKEKGLDYEFLKESLSIQKVGLVSIMQANNETGEVFDLKKIRILIDSSKRDQKIYFHSDMVQALGKMKVDLSPVDFASFSAHKFYALQGLGFIFQRKGSGLEPLISGGGQEKGRRAGTENLLAIHAFGEQVKKLDQVERVSSRIAELRDYMESEISKKIENVEFLAQDRLRASNTSFMLICGVHGETMLINMDLLGFEISTGAACSSGNPGPSPVLIAMGLSNQEASKSLRVSLGWQTTRDEINRFIQALVKLVIKLRGLQTRGK